MQDICTTAATSLIAERDFDPISLIGPPARGDLDAQRKLAMFCVTVAYDDIQTDQTVALAEAILCARLAVAQGDRDDKFRLGR